MDTEKLEILLIEDNAGDARLIRELLAGAPDAPFRLEHVDTLSKGLARLAKGGVDVILLDLSLPDSQGLESLNKILAQTLVAPILVLSGLSDEAVAIKAVQQGAQDYLVKGSADSNLLMRTIRYSIERQFLRVKLRESEARYRLLADNVADVIWTADSEARITYVSPSIKHFLGYTVEEAMKLKITNILTPDSTDQARRFMKWQIGLYAREMQPPPASMTLEHIRKDGSTVWAEVVLSFLKGKDGRIMGIMGATRDITERRKAEEALRKSEDYFKALTENASDGIVVLNGDGTVRYESLSFERILGYKPEGRLGRNSFEFVHPDDILSAAKLFEQLMQNPDSIIHTEVRAKHRDGSLHTLEVTGKNLVNNAAVGGIVANFRDITERRKAENILRESEERLRRYLESSPDAIYISDINGNFLYGNAEAERITGYAKGELLGGSFLELALLPPEYYTKAVHLLELNTVGKPTGPEEFELVRKDGSRICVEISTYPTFQGDRLEVIGIARDITARKKMEEELLRLSDAFRMSQDSIIITDLEGVIVDFNEVTLKLFGVTDNADLIGKSPADLLVLEDLGKGLESMRQAIEGEDLGTRDYCIKRKDGSKLQVEVSAALFRDAHNEPVGFVVVVRDITERKKMEEALRESEERHRLYFENASDVIYSIDKELRVVSVSPSVERLLGYRPEEFVGKLMYELNVVAPEDTEEALADTQRVLSGERILSREYEFIAKDGTRKFGDVSGAPIISSDGTVVAMVSVARDVTERKRMEEELRRLSDAIKMSQDSILITDLQGVVVDFNEATLKLFGGTDRADLIGKSPADLLVQEELEKGLESMKQAREEGSVGIQEYYIKREDGSKLQVEVSAALFRDAHNEPVGFVVVVRDITERKKMEQDLLRLSDAVRMSKDGFVITDQEGRILEANHATLKMHGFENSADIIGRLATELVAPEDIEILTDVMGQALFTGHVPYVEFGGLKNDGSKFLVEASISVIKDGNGEPTGYMGITRDITESKLAEKALRDSEAKFRALIENSHEMIILLDSDGTISYASPSVQRVMGYSSLDIVGRNVFELIHPEDSARVMDETIRVIQSPEGSRSTTEARVLHADGSWHIHEAVGTNLLHNPVIKAFVMNSRDITERRRMEEALRESEERFRAVFEGASLGIALVGFDRNVIGINPAFERVLGYSLEEFGGLTNLEYLHPDDAMLDAELYIEMLKGKRDHYTIDKRYIRKDGQVLWGRQNLSVIRGAEGKPRYFIAMLEDITERRRMEAALMQSEHNYRVLFESTFDGMLVTDVETVKVALANETLLRMFGFESLEDAIGLNPIDLVHSEDRERALGYFMEDAFGNSKPEIHEFRAITRDGREVWVSGMGRRIDYTGKPAVLSSIKDITERRRAEEERRRLEEQIQLAGRLAAVGELAAGVAHELNNPIAAIKGFAQLLAAKEDVDVGMKKDLQTIFRESQRASKITQNLLTFARRHEPEKRFISINEALERALELRAHQMKLHNVEMEEELDPHLPNTMADFYQMQQVFLNIINNAEQAMMEAHGKGKLIVRTRKVGGMIQINFIDNGPGISEENLKRIFDPFFTTKEVGRGTGLGLSICYGLVEAHCGRIYAKSKLGKGATFVVEIPIVTEAQAEAELSSINPS